MRMNLREEKAEVLRWQWWDTQPGGPIPCPPGDHEDAPHLLRAMGVTPPERGHYSTPVYIAGFVRHDVAVRYGRDRGWT